MSQLVNRMMRAARLEPELYEEVEADQSAMGQAMTVVVLASLASGIGAMGQGGMIGLLVNLLCVACGFFFLSVFMISKNATDGIDKHKRNNYCHHGVLGAVFKPHESTFI